MGGGVSSPGLVQSAAFLPAGDRTTSDPGWVGISRASPLPPSPLGLKTAGPPSRGVVKNGPGPDDRRLALLTAAPGAGSGARRLTKVLGFPILRARCMISMVMLR